VVAVMFWHGLTISVFIGSVVGLAAGVLCRINRGDT